MTREELDFIGSMNMCDEISNEAYKKIVCHCEGQEPCPNTVSRSDMHDAIGHSMSYTSEDLQKIIKALPPVNPQPCEDAISREDALMCLTGEWTEITDEIIHRFIKRIKALPSVNPQPKTGHWEWVQYDYNPKIGNWHCSECRSVVVECVSKEEKGGIPLYKYCPQCGAKMSEIPTGSDPQESEKVN